MEKVLQAFIVPFMERCIERGIVQRYFILGFSQDDFAVWNNIEFSPVLLEAVSYENVLIEIVFLQSILWQERNLI